MISGLGRFDTFQNQLFLCSETPGHQQKTRKMPSTFQKNTFSINRKIVGTHCLLTIFEKTGTVENLGYGTVSISS